MARIIVAGYMVRYPLGGQIWAHLQYVLGLTQLGHDVYFVEDFGWTDSCYDLARNGMSDDASYGVQMLSELMRRFGLDAHWAYRDAQNVNYGLSQEQLREVVRDADLLINLSGVTWFEGFERIPLRLFVDEDPVFTQVHAAKDDEFYRLVSSHQYHFSYGHNIGQPGCTVPTLDFHWQPFCQPIVLDEWPLTVDTCAQTFTTVVSWNAYGHVEWHGATYGQKSDEFPKVLTLPRHTTQHFELALSGDDVPMSELMEHGWQVCDPLRVSASVDTYRDYIQRSRGEFSVAKHAYVATRSGWFSDRSAAYLASGKPVVLQDTGYGDWLPTDAGLFAFNTLADAVAAFEQVNAAYAHHCHVARAMAAEYFEARKVLGALLARV